MNENSKLLPAILVVGSFALAFIIVGFLIHSNLKSDEPIDTEFGGQVNEPRDVFGTTTGTSTSPTTNLADADYPYSANSDFSDAALGADNGYPTTSKTMMLGGMTDTVALVFTPLTASSSEGSFYYDIFGSNDAHCTTTATSTTDDDYDTSGTIPIIDEIHWFDIGADNARISGGMTGLGVGANATGTAEIITDVCWKCLRVDLRGASSTVGVQLIEKINQ